MRSCSCTRTRTALPHPAQRPQAHLGKKALEGAVEEGGLLHERPAHPLWQQALRGEHPSHRRQRVRRHRGVAACRRQREQVAQQQLPPQLLALGLVLGHAAAARRALPARLARRLALGACTGRGQQCMQPTT